MIERALDRPGRAVGIVACVALGVLAIALALPDRFTSAGFTDPSAQSTRASALLTRALGHDPEPGLVVLTHAASPIGFDDPSARAAVARLAALAAADPAVGATEQPFGPRPVTTLLSRDRRTALVLVYFRRAGIDAAAAPIDRLRPRLRDPRLTVALGGYPLSFLDGNSAARSDLVRAELIAFPVLALLMIGMFRGVVAAAIPLIVGAVAVAVTFAVLRLLATVIGISIFALDLAALLGLGLAVDYSLLLVSRYREEAVVVGPGRAAIMRAARASAGRSVVLSGAAVAGACAALLAFPEEFINSMGVAGILVALLAAGSALALTPPLLLLAGPGALRRDAVANVEAHPDPDRWERWAGWVMRHRFDAALVAVLVLIAAAAPALRLAPTLADASALPANFQSRQVTDSIDATFVPHLLYPVDIAVHTSGARSSSGSARASALPAGLLAVSLQRTGAAQVVAVTPGRLGTTLVQAVLRSPPYAARSQALIRGVRALPSRPLVGGNTAEFVDLKHSIAARAPWAILIAAVVTVLVLLVLTRSIVLAAKSLVLDLLGLGAALGLLVLIFQHRALGVAGFLGFHGPSAIETTSAVVIVASAYGLTTDYSVLLLARIVEAHDAGADDRDAVATGVARTAPVITSAALLLTVALLALTSSRLFLIKQLTVGQILAVLVDVTVVRLLLVPAFMAIFGGANWWAPRWIRSALRRVAPAPHA